MAEMVVPNTTHSEQIDSSVGWFARGRDAFLKALSVWSFVFLLVLFPLDLLFQIDAMAMSLSLFGIIRLCAGLVVIFSAFTVAAALACGAAAMLPIRFKGITAHRTVLWLNTLIACTFSLHVIMQIFLFWTIKISKNDLEATVQPIQPTTLVAVAFAISLLLFIAKKDVPTKLLMVTKRFTWLVIIMVSLSVAIAVYVLSTVDRYYQPGNTASIVAERKPKARPNIILISFDALSAEHMSLYGYSRKTTPNLEAFAASAYLFPDMIANGNWTTPGTASIITGKYPLTHRVGYLTPDVFLANRHENLANILKNTGYQTAMVTGNMINANPKKHGTFADFDIIYDETHTGENFGLNSLIINPLYLLDVNLSIHYLSIYRYYYFPYQTLLIKTCDLFRPVKRSAGTDFSQFNSSEPHFNEASKLLQKHIQPFFLWCHVYPPHAPYLASPQYLYTFRKEHILDTVAKLAQTKYHDPQIMHDRYDELLLSADQEFGIFVKSLREQGLFDNSIIIVTADHGEVFSETKLGHGGNTLPSPLIHIPLAIHLPGQNNARLVTSPAEQVDIAPTILDYLGLEPPTWMEGESLRRVMKSGQMSQKAKFSMNLDEDSIHGPVKRGVVAVMKDGYKLTHDFRQNSYELYNLKDDPREKTNLAGREQEKVKLMDRFIRDRIAQSEKNRERSR